MKVYDCFLFFNELDLLEIRLNELNDVVDKFVIVESTESFSKKKKPLYFQENNNFILILIKFLRLKNSLIVLCFLSVLMVVSRKIIFIFFS